MPRRRLGWDVLLVVLGAAELALTLLPQSEGQSPWPPVVGFALVLALLLRHRPWWPWLLPLIMLINVWASSFIVMVVAVFAFANRCSTRFVVPAVALVYALAASLPSWWAHGWQDAAAVTGSILLLIGISATFGMYISASRRLLVQLQQRAAEAEQSRSVAEEEARTAERTRIAREMHDIVAHKISLVALQAGALEVNQNLEKEQVSEAAGLIRQTAASALAELREVLGVLRRADESAPLMPQPTWDDVRGLVKESQEAGVAVELFDFIDDPVPDGLARTAYRVVQEGLTNIHKHARHTKARVALIGEPGSDLVIEVSNVLPKGFTTDLPGARMGLSGIETRVSHAGGTITSGPTDDGRFEVKAVIPWPTT